MRIKHCLAIFIYCQKYNINKNVCTQWSKILQGHSQQTNIMLRIWGYNRGFLVTVNKPRIASKNATWVDVNIRLYEYGHKQLK